VTFVDFQVGQRLEIDFPGLKCWTTLRGWVPDKILFADLPRAARRGKLIQKGMECQVQYVVSEGIRVFRSRVEEVILSDPSFIHLRYPREVRKQRLRSDLRVRTYFHGVIWNAGGQADRATVLDISRRGCLLENDGIGLGIGEEISLGAILPNHALFAAVPSVVRRLQEPSQRGLEFSELTAEQERNLDLFLRESQRHESFPIKEEGGSRDVGDFEKLALPLLCQLIAASGRCYRADVWDEPRTGSLYFDHGMLIHASVASLRGGPAFQEMLLWGRGQFCLSIPGELPHKNVFEGLEEFLRIPARMRRSP
jgi:c-di-GMP-binding flagellar brake protein YcgR